jgi:hypothetical protein
LCETTNCLFLLCDSNSIGFFKSLDSITLILCSDSIKALAMQRLYKPKRLSIQYV